ncbi:hypothetical protein KFL_000530370 [Klebsormidium nitens]|uniref:Uncharacterized protein n=1 Tax=Klebsormidium nitens TaxID=105231 RepID=A0A1Y1HP53_KLENI|nr:hypothetical protein KFL_000530370 [Klebsormidium nitens]|eukprot:GAQ80410.1 hypothetical protein KFL_000530370 [Klebsormidium nitens]
MPGNFTSSVFESMDQAARTNALAAVGGKVQLNGEEDQVLKEITSPVLENVEGESIEQAQTTLEDGTDTLEGQSTQSSEEKKGDRLEEVEPTEVKSVEEPAEDNTEISQVQVREREPVPEETPRGRVRSRLLSARDFNGDRPKGDPVLWDGTIFVGMAAYRDPDCQDTVWSAFSMAANPERVSLGIYQQHADEDQDCLAFQHVICPPQNRSAMVLASPEEKANRPWFKASPEEIAQVCTGLKRVAIKRVGFMEGMGPTVARYYTQTLVGDQTFFLQVDSHSHFIWAWDVEILRNWKATGNAKAVISGTYPVPHTRMPEWLKRPHPQVPKGDGVVQLPMMFDMTEAVDYRRIDETDMSPNGPLPPLEGFELDYIPDIVAIICQIKYVHDASDMPRCESAQFVRNPGHPIKVPFWTAGISFSTTQAIKDVPYDPYTPYLFDGEEFSTAARLWTWGYDVYAPFTDIVFHVYESRYKRNKYWEIDWGERYRIQQISARRIRYILGMPLPADAEFDRTELERFGLGKVRPLQEFLDMAGIDLVNMTSFHICAEVQAGRFPDPNRNLTQAKFVDPAQPLEHTKPPAPPEPESRDETLLEVQEGGATAQEGVKSGVENGLVSETETGLEVEAETVSVDAQAQAVEKREAKLGGDAQRGDFEEVRQKGP